jgi:hypothetical protein
MAGAILLVLALVGISTFVPGTVVQQNDAMAWVYPLVVIGLALAVVALVLTALTGALIQLSRLGQTRWLWILIGSAASFVVFGLGVVLTPLALIVYSVVGPTAASRAPLAMPTARPDASPSEGVEWLGILSLASSLVFPLLVGLRLLTRNAQLPDVVRALVDTVGGLQIPAILVAIVSGHLAFTSLNPAKAHRRLALFGLVLGYASIMGFVLLALAFAGV